MILSGSVDVKSREFQVVACRVISLRDKHHATPKRSGSSKPVRKVNNAGQSTANCPNAAEGDAEAQVTPTEVAIQETAPAAQADRTRASGNVEQHQPTPATRTHAMNITAPVESVSPTPITGNDAALAQVLHTNAELSGSIATLVRENAESGELVRKLQAERLALEEELRRSNERYLNNWPARLMSIR
ncbi:hypothetical protein JDV02_004503 [Purpureocillium takamizusanense]|uniref:Uncharacterized protein n=1 Tax=Purpureocillium takamizusanense TaxID=2060973 RepID=A0A9Q8QFG2_9HYPO|nr:uncharacterized protein JDV02_004503 [Purpureocillium takamizusanense]UNI18221.1 hypothetical protein JDV02_004503 [Purpureocillium takamizusanense]